MQNLSQFMYVFEALKKKISVCSFPYVCCIYILLDVYSLIHFLDTKQFWFSYMDITL